jgi:MFS transporter, DHA1 family, inner membrane transport protein
MTVIEQSYRGSVPRLILLAVGMFLVGTNAFVIAGLLPRIAADLGTDQAAVSYSITVYALLVAVASPVVSIGMSRVPRAILMASGALLFAVGVGVAASSTTLGLFIAGRVIAALGGAALVPTATAVAATIVGPEHRGRALALVGAGFTLAVAVGSPLGTELGTVLGWRPPMLFLGIAGLVVAVALVPAFRRMPHPASVSFRRRLEPLRDPRVLVTLGATLLVVTGFNVVYIFSAEVTHRATAGSGGLLAMLLFVFGAAGLIGNFAAGRVTDRAGSRTAAGIAIAVQIVALATLAAGGTSLAVAIVVFAVWGAVASGVAIPLQHRLVQIEPAQAAQSLAWYSTAMYLGIAIAPPLGNAALGVAGPWAVPVAGAAVSIVALALLLAGYRMRRRSAVGMGSVGSPVGSGRTAADETGREESEAGEGGAVVTSGREAVPCGGSPEPVSGTRGI